MSSRKKTGRSLTALAETVREKKDLDLEVEVLDQEVPILRAGGTGAACNC